MARRRHSASINRLHAAAASQLFTLEKYLPEIWALKSWKFQLLMKLANDKWLCVWLAFRSWELRSWAKSNGLPSIIIIIDCQEYKDLFHPSFGGKTVRNIALWSLIAAFKILWSLVDLYQHRALSIIIGWPVTRQAESSLIPFQLFTYRQLRQVLDFQHHLSSENFWWWLIECSFFKSCQSF